MRRVRVAREASACRFHSSQVVRRACTPATVSRARRLQRVGSDVAGAQRPGVAPGEGGGGQVAGWEAGEGAGALPPVGEQVGQRVRGLGRAGVPARPLGEPGALDPGRGAAVLGAERVGELPGAGGDLGGALGELGEQPVLDAVDLERRGAAAAPVPQRPADRQGGGEPVGEQVVVQLGDGDRGLVQPPPVQGAPPAVHALHLVRDDQVGVQVRVPGAGVPVIERGGDHPADPHALGAGVADAGAGHPLLHEPQHIGDGLPVRPRDQLPGGLVGQRPQHAHRLRHRERQVEPGHRVPRPPPVHRGIVRQRPAERLVR